MEQPIRVKTSLCLANDTSNSEDTSKTSISLLGEHLTHEQHTIAWSKSKEAHLALISVLSALYALVLVIIALALEVSTFIAGDMAPKRYDLFYTYVYGVGLLFLLYCYTFLMAKSGWWRFSSLFLRRNSDNSENAEKTNFGKKKISLIENRIVTYSCSHNMGSMYLRLGATAFGTIGVICKTLHIFLQVDHWVATGCQDFYSLTRDAVFMLFIFVQLYFIYQNSKVTIHKFVAINRFGCMHLIAANICSWIGAIVFEENHIKMSIEENTKRMRLSEGDKSAYLGTALDSTFRMQTAQHHPAAAYHGPRVSNCLNGSHNSDLLMSQIQPFMSTCLVEFSVICAAVMYILWRNVGKKTLATDSKFRKQHLRIDCGSSTKGFFVGLIFVAFTFSSMIIFFTKTTLKKDSEALWIFHLSDCFLYMVSTVAIFVAMFQMRNLHYFTAHTQGALLDDMLLIVGLIGQLLMCIFTVVALTKATWISGLIVVTSLFRMVQVLLQTMFIFFAQHVVARSKKSRSEKPGRETVTFLLMVNLAMFFINTFEAQKAGSNPVSLEFYGVATWATIVYSTVPLTVFYRFHSTVCLAEIWKKTYRVPYHSSV